MRKAKGDAVDSVALVVLKVTQLMVPLVSMLVRYCLGLGPKPAFLEHLPDTLKSEIELERLEQAAKKKR